MKSVRFWAFFLGLLFWRLPLPGQEASVTNAVSAIANDPATTAATVAEQQGEEEKFKRVTADIESLRAANQALTDKLTGVTDKLAAVAEELRQAKAEQTRQAGETTVPDQLKLLAQKIEEVDKKRMDDKTAISDEISKSSARLLKLLTDATSVTAPKMTNRPSTNPPPESGNGVKYAIKDGDTLVAIMKAYNETFKSQGKKTITKKQIEDVNPGVDWNRLKIGQQIIVPLPPE